MCYKIAKADPYKVRSESRLTKLAKDFSDNYIDTDYELLLQSQYYDRTMKVSLNESKIPIITSKKYILVPTNSYSGEIIDEHVLGTKEYVLSVGTPKKVRKLVPAKANI